MFKINNRPIFINGDFLQQCYDISIDSVNINIETNSKNYSDIILSCLNGLTQKDSILDEQLYSHLEELNIKKKIKLNHLENQIPDKYFENINTKVINNNIVIEKSLDVNLTDLVIVDVSNTERINNILEMYANKVSKGIIVKKYSNDNLLEISGYSKKITIDYIYYEVIYEKENIDNLNYQYELMEYVDFVFRKHKVKYCAINESCLGCFRNRSHIISSDMTICRPALSNDKYKVLLEYFKINYSIVLTRDLIYFQKKPEVMIFVEQKILVILNCINLVQ